MSFVQSGTNGLIIEDYSIAVYDQLEHPSGTRTLGLGLPSARINTKRQGESLKAMPKKMLEPRGRARMSLIAKCIW